ncbi:MFS-type transporter, putative [Plasmodium knowlesi strain H]|uniref:MFS-type transporter, putative n=3 Tax=Plasmodium knowlesi TaxID=5850 RepID=A0A5E7X2X2_PLAKH|nr:MFS-type transporter, putative [Plasmodium knowlesi strain H]OTN65459.1 putative MFS-type transporter [Plasmodium knowlesi]CAA9989598.1 MFS-type transporter, putative [Plasmodium knowlesi strain H]SBO22664.1 MFS-type transporter, putative [Plasmodium knowlesi strain H]SBO23338.1 MFS-type transporter, putative [Plasmodium knowlesi strain H]VVS79072.1 MFS-type transporter, putative [Plasmodium knowlesi strain H]
MKGRYELVDAPHKRRWLMLFFFSYCCMVDNLICFTFSPISTFTYKLYGISNNIFPQVYLVIYSIFSIPLSFLLSECSLRSNVVCSSLLQFMGCLLRYIYWENLTVVMFGQFLSSIGQIIFVNAPPEVSLVWFPEKERIISTSVSIISNALGTAIIYLYVPLVVINEKDIQVLLSHICLASFIGCVMVTLCFENNPPPTITSSVLSNAQSSFDMKFHSNFCMLEEDQNFDTCYLCMDSPAEGISENKITKCLKELRRFLVDLKGEIENILTKEEIIKILIIFCYSECLISSFSADMSIVLREKMISKNYFSLAGSLFICNTILGSAIVCLNANSAHFKLLILICICMIMSVCVLLYLTGHPILIILTLSLIGFWSGPLQPICVEMASIRIYPINSNLCTSLLQVISFSVSAIFISFFSYISTYVTTPLVIFFLSVLMLLVGLRLKPISGKDRKRREPGTTNNISFSYRSGLLNRNTLIRTNKFADLSVDLFDDLFHERECDDPLFGTPPADAFLQRGSSSDSENIVQEGPIKPGNIPTCVMRKMREHLGGEDYQEIELNRKLNLDNLKKDLFFYNEKVESWKGGSKSFSRNYCDEYSEHFDEEKMNLPNYNTC